MCCDTYRLRYHRQNDAVIQHGTAALWRRKEWRLESSPSPRSSRGRFHRRFHCAVSILYRPPRRGTQKAKATDERQSWLCAVNPADAEPLLGRVYVPGIPGYSPEDDYLP